MIRAGKFVGRCPGLLQTGTKETARPYTRTGRSPKIRCYTRGSHQPLVFEHPIDFVQLGFIRLEAWVTRVG